MDAIAEVKRRLQALPGLAFTQTADSIEVAPSNRSGFPVALTVEPKGFTVYFGGWHEHFESAREAVNCFSYGLRGDCRLRISYRGSTPYKWTLEHRREGQWVAESTTGSFLIPFWRRRQETLLSNQGDGADGVAQSGT